MGCVNTSCVDQKEQDNDGDDDDDDEDIIFGRFYDRGFKETNGYNMYILFICCYVHFE